MFVIVGERINTSRKRVQEAVEAGDVEYIQEDVGRQQKARACYIDVNAGARIGHEARDMEWLLRVIGEVTDGPLCIDSPNPEVIEMAFSMLKSPPLINSISLERNRYDAMMSFLRGKHCKIVALCMDDSGMPANAGEVVNRAKRLVRSLEEIGFERDSIFVDPMVQPVSTNTVNAASAMEAIRGIKTEIQGVHCICGLSNVSFGLPQRRIINRTFLSLMMASGLDAAILDPLDRSLMSVLKTTEMLLGEDAYCARYLKAVRPGDVHA